MTGSTNFIGQTLTHHLHQQNNAVIAAAGAEEFWLSRDWRRNGFLAVILWVLSNIF